MLALLPTILSLVTTILPLVTGGTVAASPVIGVLTQIVPIAIQTGTALLPEIQSIIAALTGGAALTAAEMATLTALDAQCDAAFESAASAAGDPAPASI